MEASSNPEPADVLTSREWTQDQLLALGRIVELSNTLEWIARWLMGLALHIDDSDIIEALFLGERLGNMQQRLQALARLPLETSDPYVEGTGLYTATLRAGGKLYLGPPGSFIDLETRAYIQDAAAWAKSAKKAIDRRDALLHRPPIDGVRHPGLGRGRRTQQPEALHTQAQELRNPRHRGRPRDCCERKTGAFPNIIIGVGVLSVAAYVLIRALRLIFTVRRRSRLPASTSARVSSTHELPVIWSRPWTHPDGSASGASPPSTPAALSTAATTDGLRRSLWATASAFAAVLALTAVLALPELLDSILQSQTVGSAHIACSDGVDNDRDGKEDYPQDPECSSKYDPAERL
jgi:hypothetical protein